MKICFLQSSQSCGRYRPECRQIVANIKDGKITVIPSEADVIVQFFCIETDQCIQEAANQLHYLGKLKKANAKLIIAGCAANVLGEEFLQFPEVDYVIQRKPVAKAVLEILGYQDCENQYFMNDDIPSYVIQEISNGCQKKYGACNFCFQGITRIPVKSKPMDYLLTAIKNSTAEGAKGVSLIALNTCNYGIDFPEHKPLLHELIKKVSAIKNVKIIDVYSLTVADMYSELLQELITNPKVRLVEMGIQCGSNHLLQIMHTGSTIEEIEKLLQSILSCKQLKTIVIVGHPGETEEDFESTLHILRKYNLWYSQVNPYMLIEGTKSSKMEQIPLEIIQKRYQKAKEMLSQMREQYLNNLIGTTVRGYIKYAIRQSDSSVRVYFDDFYTPITFCYSCSQNEYDQKFGNMSVFDIISCVAKKVISYEANPLIEVTDIKE